MKPVDQDQRGLREEGRSAHAEKGKNPPPRRAEWSEFLPWPVPPVFRILRGVVGRNYLGFR